MPFATVIWIGILLATIIQLTFWLGFMARLHKTKNFKKEELPSVSVVICAKDEASNLNNYLPLILRQGYPDYEVIVVDDHSKDDSKKVLKDLKNNYPKLKTLHLGSDIPDRPGKKQALQKGIALAQNELLLLTDADCNPSSEQWIHGMVAALKSKDKMVLGYGPYKPRPGLLNKFIRFETVTTAMQYFTMAQNGLPYMGVGRNLLIDRSLYQANAHHLKPELISGDDDLMVNALASRTTIRTCLSSSAFCESEAAPNFRSFWRQKTRHLSVGKHYRLVHKLFLGGLALSQFGMYFFLVLAFYSPTIWGFFLLRLGVAWIVFWIKAPLLAGRDLRPWYPLLDGLQVVYFIIFSPYIFLIGAKKWGKGR